MITDKGVLLCRAIVLCCTNRKPALLPPDLFVEYIIINSLLVKGCAVMYKQKTRTSTARPFLSRTQSLIPFWLRVVLWCTNRKPGPLPPDLSCQELKSSIPFWCRVVLWCTNRKPALLPPDFSVEYIIIDSLMVKDCAVMYKQKTRTSTARPFLSRTQSLIPFWCRSVLLCTNRKPALLPSDSSVKYNITDFPLMESCAVMYKQKTRTSTTRPSCQVHHHWLPSDGGLRSGVQTENQKLYQGTFLSSTSSFNTDGTITTVAVLSPTAQPKSFMSKQDL